MGKKVRAFDNNAFPQEHRYIFYAEMFSLVSFQEWPIYVIPD